MLERVIERARQATLVDQVVVACPHDLEIKLDVPVFIGDEQDVLKRYYDCAKRYRANTIVRVTSDCPLIIPDIIDDCVHFRNLLSMDYVAAVEPHYPDGLDTEVFTFGALEEANKYATSRPDREHVTPYMRRNCGLSYYLDFWEGRMDKVSVDTLQDLRKVRKIWNGKIKQYSL